MARRSTTGLWLLVASCLLCSEGCRDGSNESSRGDAAGQANSPVRQDTPPAEQRPLADLAMELWQRDIDQYRAHTQDPEAIRPQVEEFLRTVQLSMLPNPRGPGVAETTAMGKKLLEQGCQDPLMRTYYGQVLCDDPGGKEALRVLVDALNDFRKSTYPHEYRRVGTFAVYSEMRDYGVLIQPELRQDLVAIARSRITDPSIGADKQRVVLCELGVFSTQECGRDYEGLQALHDACRNAPGADPWLLHMIAGRTYVAQGWRDRGGGWAYKVTPEGWEGFHENLQKAAEHYSEALKLHPDYPEAAGDMIRVAMAGEDGRSPREWFDQAVAMEFDYMPAYASLRWAIRPRWGGTIGAMYDFGCECADTKRYDTEVPFTLLFALNDIDNESGWSGAIWNQEGVYPRVKRVLEEMARDASRGDAAAALYPTKWRVMSVHVAMAQRAGQQAEARRLLDELGNRFDRRAFEDWCIHPDSVLADIYAMTGKGAKYGKKAWQTLLDAPTPITNETFEEVKNLYRKAMEADDNPWSRECFAGWMNEIECRKAFNDGDWFVKKFDPKLLCWTIADGAWSVENEHSAVGHGRRKGDRVRLRPFIVPPLPFEIEFDLESPRQAPFPMTLGLFIPEATSDNDSESGWQQFFVRTSDNVAGIDLGGESKTVPCELRPVNHFRIQLAEGRAVLHVNGHLCVDRSDESFRPIHQFNIGCQSPLHRQMEVRISNVRIRKWNPPAKPPAAEEKSQDTPATEKEADGGDEENRAEHGSSHERPSTFSA